MSNISTELSMNGLLFTENEIVTGTVFELKILFWLMVMCIIFSCLTSLTQSLYGTNSDSDTYSYNCGCNKNCKCQGTCNINCGCECTIGVEQFGNDKFYSYKDTVYPNYTSYQSAPLTPLDESLNFGQANRYIKASDDGSKPMSIIYDVYCNLYLLNGNIFGQDSVINKPIKQNYIAYLRKDDNRKLLGQLTANSDQIYKLKFTTDKPEDYIKFNNIDIVYSDLNDKETTILSGRFTVA